MHIFPTQIQAQQPGVVSLITGFNLNVRIFLSYSSLATAEMAFGVDEVFDWDRQQRILEQSLQRCRAVLDSIPDLLKVHGRPGYEPVQQPKQPYYPPMPEYQDMRNSTQNGFTSAEVPDKRRYEIQKANVYASHLATRSYLVEKYFFQLEKAKHAKTQATSTNELATGLDRLVGAAPIDVDRLEKTMSDERDQVVKDLLVVLGSIDMVSMEPSGDSFVSPPYHFPILPPFLSLSHSLPYFSSRSPISQQTQKIRAIARTLLDVPHDRKGSVALQHQDYLYKFLDILSKLERVGGESSGEGSGVAGGEDGRGLDEESELRLWADLREHQLRFQEGGGVYGFS